MQVGEGASGGAMGIGVTVYARQPRGSTEEPSAGVFFPTVPRGDGYPTAGIEGVLEVRSDWLFVSVDGDRWLRLWPEGYMAQSTDGRIEIVDEAGERVGREGDEVRLGGGETRPVEVGGTADAEQWASELTGLDIPERCGDLYWIVSPF